MGFVNEGSMDRAARIVVGVALLGLGWGGVVDGTVGTVFKFLGFVPLLTGLIGFCPVYPLLGMSTRRK
jgi:hypothetical protein